MKKITVIATFRIEDNGILIEKLKDSLLCESFRSIKVFPDDNELYSKDETYKNLCNEYKKIKEIKENYLREHLESGILHDN